MAYVLQQLLTKSAKNSPDKPAVWARGKSITYRELDERSNQLAQLLRQRGVQKGDRVGLFFPKCVESIVSMLGVLKAGGVYVPLDPQAPSDRIGYIIGNCGIRILITNSERRSALAAETVDTLECCILIDGEGNGGNLISWSQLAEYPASHAPAVTLVETDLAYILYTSGSTGRPKGVMLTHQNALTFVEWCAEEFQVRSEDRLSNHAPLHFDLSVFDVYNTLEAGATVYLITEDLALFPTSLANFIENQQITIWYSVPSALMLLLLHGRLTSEKLKSLRVILFAGEVFPMKYLRQLAEVSTTSELYNLYGPTETNVCTYYKVEREQLAALEKLPIGIACANTECFSVTPEGRLAGNGEAGELYVRGPSVTYGYWADPEKTKKMCVPNHFQENFEEKMYRTGDIVTVGEDGNYYFQGRRDSMIKSRGYRIELGEIESALLSHPGVREAAVLAVPDEVIGNRIRAVVAPHIPGSLGVLELQQYCASRVPKYMIPELVDLYDELPKTSTGKIDRVKLASEPAGAVRV
ncbi:MAG TPA: amino acid adenylation domain-containing protein [Candidatus Sulfotelmatobacter sp.]|nr:amino acid adenylation domain-containing protein [Candidatus Sulfotelmatobacter sp.]